MSGMLEWEDRFEQRRELKLGLLSSAVLGRARGFVVVSELNGAGCSESGTLQEHYASIWAALEVALEEVIERRRAA